MLNHMMLDTETWGTSAGCAIRSVGAVMFDPYQPDKFGGEFYMNITRQSCEDAKLVIDPNTEAWWSKQTRDAQDSLDANQCDLKHVAEEFVRFFDRSHATYVWSQGANFDDPVWGAAMRAVGVSSPWKFWNSRCTRTAYGIAGLNFNRVPRVGTAHNALADSKHQVRCVWKSFQLLGKTS